VNVLLYVVWLPRAVYVDDSAASRAAVGVVLAALYCLPAWWTARGRLVVTAGAFTFSIAWYLIVAAALGLNGLQHMTT
jgi:hypothetical protein